MRLKLSLLLVFITIYSWSQSGSTKTFTGNGTFSVPAGVTSLNVQAWGGGGSGGGAGGAPLLLGRGAAGGGGGAFAANNIAVTPGTTLNVVVASQTSGTTGAGIAGGNSTIAGFESSILATGGSGGDANNAGGSPVGGAGGTVAASAGSVRFAGANGGNGNSWNLLGLLLSSGAGGAGASSGGAGGTAVSGLILSNAPGNAGSPPGGAGSGAINSASGASQIGGAGAAGRVIISYSCANFSLTSTAATNVCASSGSTSTVTLTGSAASLPVGNYVVTYNRSSPSATALTANLTVSIAGTGTFTAVGLTTAGSSTITITKLTSETCSSTITTNNIATITVSPATVGGTVTGGTTIGTGSSSGLLTLSGHTGSVVKWQSSVSPFSTWVDIANTTATYTSAPLTETTQFRAVVKSGACGIENSAATTVAVEDLPTIALSFIKSVCPSASTQETILHYEETTGSPVTYSIVWDPSPANSFVPVTDAVLPASPITIAVPAGVVAGTYTGTLTVKNSNGTTSLGSTFELDVLESPSMTISGPTSVCASSNIQYATLPYSATTGSPTSYSIDWKLSTSSILLDDQSSTPFSFVSSGGIINTIVIAANAQPGLYSGNITISNGSCSETQRIVLTIFPPLGAPVIGEITPSKCAQSIGSVALSGLPTGNWTIVTDPVTVTTTGSGESTVISGLEGTYDYTFTVSNAYCTSPASEPATVPLDIVLDGGEVSGGTTISSGSTSGLLTLSGHLGIIVKWQYAVSPFTTWVDIANTSTTYTSGPLTETTEFAAILHDEGETCEASSETTTVTVNPAPSISIDASANAVCPSASAQETILHYSATTGSPITYSIVWDSSPANSFVPVTNAVLPASPITIAVPDGAVPGIYTGILTVKNVNGTISLGSTFEIEVLPALSILITGASGASCTSSSLQYGGSRFYEITGNPISYYIDWDQAANDALLQDQPNTPFTFEPNEGYIETEISANAQPGSYNGTFYVTDGVCIASFPIYESILPLPTAPIIGAITPGPDGSVALSGLPSSNWIIVSNPEGVNINGSGETTVITGLAPGEYTFTVEKEAGCTSLESAVAVVPSASGLFKGILPKDSATVEDLESTENTILIATLNKQINVNAFNQTIKQVFVYDVSGNLLYQKDAVGNSKLNIGNLKASNQVLVVKVVLDNYHTQTRKVIY